MKIKLQSVVAFSSQDEKYPVENLVNNFSSSAEKKWLSSPFDKSGRLEAEFELEFSASIHYIDIGNCGSSTVELQVGSSMWPRNKPYICLLPTVLFMTAADVKSRNNVCLVKMFNKEDINSETLGQKFDRLKVICCQPYIKTAPFGLSFLRLSNDDLRARSSVVIKTMDFYSHRTPSDCKKHFTSTPVTNQPMTTALPPTHCMRRLMLEKRKQNIEQEEDTSELETNILLFLTAKNAEDANAYMNDCLKEYEETHMLSLTENQKDIFEKVYSSVFTINQNAYNRSSKDSSRHSDFNFSVPTPKSKTHKIVKRQITASPPLTQNRKSLNGLSFFERSYAPKKVKTSPIRHSQEDLRPRSLLDADPFQDPYSDPFQDDNCDFRSSGIVSVGASTEFASYNTQHYSTSNSACSSSSSWQAEDFIQHDGSMPGTSKDASYQDCPICSKSFHIDEIAFHASSCEEYLTHIVSSDDDDIEAIWPPNVRVEKCRSDMDCYPVSSLRSVVPVPALKTARTKLSEGE